MRLTAGQQKIIKSAVARIVGADSRVWLFGSRADDTRRGGDIDLLVETPQQYLAVSERYAVSEPPPIFLDTNLGLNRV